MSKKSTVGAAQTDELLAEWKKHASAYMTSWLREMTSRGRVRFLRDRALRDYRKAISALPDKGSQSAMLKDAHLVEAAIREGLAVISRDDKQKAHLVAISGTYTLASKVVWVHPEHPDCIVWLNSGCSIPLA